MATSESTVKIYEITRVTPSPDSPNSANEFSLPVTFFDTYWFKFPPVQSLYLYQLSESHSTLSYFNSEILPRLKQSLSFALSHYLPIAGYLKWPSNASKPVVSYTPNDSVSLTVAVSNVANFDTLISNEMHKANELHPLAPQLILSDDKAEILALQITLFPGRGFCIGTAAHHAVFDGKIASMFMRSWAYLCKYDNTNNELPPDLTPSFDRSIIKDPSGLDTLFLNQWRDIFAEYQVSNTRSFRIPDEFDPISDDVVRATFKFSNKDINGLRKKATNGEMKQQLYLSSFVLTLAYTTTCLVKTKGEGQRDVVIDFGVDCRARLDPPAPPTYFGNCVVNYSNSAEAGKFMGEEGFAFAIDMVSELVQKVKRGVLEGAEMKVTNFYAPKLPGTQLIIVAGSPKLNVYEADFGLNSTIKKVEIVSIERDEAVFMAESKGGNGGVEVGLALKKHEMEKFAALFSVGLTSLH
ncbi:Gag protease polyprotein [Hibiscus syriacus]|uniref:Gag protease polyprotein n=1 Tax=Hibiscus syriacus TaxID=106335 RepID=A0A6A3B0M4_HIBSY|nr:phenolic glucoside malonyltransferase 1-like [Hibiscus syriacus]KAE8710211.1 Gag protease polyprotein [Hibiscus syriacus]